MFTGLAAAGIMGGASLLGGILGNKSQDSANQLNAMIAYDQLRFQKDYTKNRLQWQVEDAKKAGLHPMVAAGLSPTSFSPVSANQQAVDYSWLGDMAQNVDYSLTKAKTQKQQAQAFDFMVQSQDAQVKGLKLDNALKEIEIASMLARLNQTGPAAPDLNGKNPLSLIGGQDDSVSPDSSFTSGTNPLLGLSRVGNTLMAHINPDISDSITEDVIRTQLANLNAEFQAGRLTPEVARRLSENEKRMLARGDAVLEYTPPSTWRFRLTNKMRPRYSNDKKEVSGKLNFSKLSY